MNKYQVRVILPFLEKSYEVLLPINKKIGTVRKYIIVAVANLLEISPEELQSYNLINAESGNVYDYNQYVKDSDIENGTDLLLL